MLSLEKISASVHEAAKEFPITKVDLFGSYADGRASEKSDVDLLVEFNTPGISLFVLSGLKYRMEDLLGTEVDIIHGPLGKNAMIEVGNVVPIL